MTSQLKLQYKGYFLATLSAFCAALFFIPYKQGLQTMKPDVYVLAMYIVGFMINLFGSKFKSEKVKFNLPTLLGAIAFAVISVMGNFSIGKAMVGLEPSIAVVILRIQTLYVMFLGWLILKERLDVFLIPGGILAIIGFFWMNYEGNGQITLEWSFYLWALGAACCFGTSQVMIKFIVNQINPMTLNHLRLLIGGALLCFYPGVLSSLFQLTFTEWLLVIVSAITGPLLSRLFQIYALKYIQVSQSILFGMLIPVFTLILSVMFFGTYPTFQQMTGAIIIIFSILVPMIHLIKENKEINVSLNH